MLSWWRAPHEHSSDLEGHQLLVSGGHLLVLGWSELVSRWAVSGLGAGGTMFFNAASTYGFHSASQTWVDTVQNKLNFSM